MNHLRLLLARGWTLVLAGVATLAACSTIDDPVAQCHCTKSPPTGLKWFKAISSLKNRFRRLRPGMSRNQVKDILGTPLDCQRVSCRPLGLRFHHSAQRHGPPATQAVGVFQQRSGLSVSMRKTCPARPSSPNASAVPEDRKAVPRLQATPARAWTNSAKPHQAANQTAVSRSPIKPAQKAYPPLRTVNTQVRTAMNATRPTSQVAIAGASGRMGRMLAEAIVQAPDCQLAGALDVAESSRLIWQRRHRRPSLGDASGVLITSDMWRKACSRRKVLIDFTRPEGTMAHLAVCRQRGVQMVIGTTGFSRGPIGRDPSGQSRHRRS